MKQWLSALVLLLLGVLPTACGDHGPVKIGVVAALSGRYADLGVGTRDGVAIAVDERNAQGGLDGRPIEVLVRDHGGDPEAAAAAVRELHREGVVAIIGPNLSTIAAGMLPVLDELEVVAISPTVSSTSFAGRDDFFFRLNDTADQIARDYVRHYAERGVRRFAVIFDATNRLFAQSWLEPIVDELRSVGGELVAEGSFDAAQGPTYADLVDSILAGRPEAVILLASGTDTAMLAQQIRLRETEVLLIAAQMAADSEQLFHLGGRAVEGLEVGRRFDPHSTAARYAAFREAMVDRFGREPEQASVAAHDAASLLFAALEGRRGGETVRDALRRIDGVDGLQQEIRLDAFGDGTRPIEFVIVRDGAFVRP